MQNLILPIFLMIMSVIGCTSDKQKEESAETIYINGKIYTVSESKSWAEAVAIKDGKFIKVGTNDDIEEFKGAETKTIDLQGKFVMPGMIDAHNHAMGASMGRANLYIKNPDDKEKMIEEIKQYADENLDLPFIRGEAWNLGVFTNNSPRKELLDEIISDRPVYFYSQTGHSAWVNSKTLDLIDIDASSKQDNRYIWDVDPQTGEPTGTIREFTMSLVEQALEPTSADKIAPKIRETLKTFSKNGFTTLKLAEGEESWIRAANQLDEKSELDVRLFPSWFHNAHNGAMKPEESYAMAARWEEFVTPMVYPRYVKMYADGSSASYSSLLLEDYSDRPGFNGNLSFPYEEYVNDFAYFNKLGLGMIVHVYGDGTSQKIIKAFEVIQAQNGINGIPLHFSHSFMTTPEQIKRLSKISNISMDFITLQYPHPAIEENFVTTIGEERWQKWINVKSAAEIGIPYGFGSDWPAALEPTLNGFFQMQGFITRQDPNNPNSGTLNEMQAINLEQAIYGWTKGGAACLGFDWPEKLGSIEPGKFADFIILDRNIFELPTEELKLTQVDKTIVGGKVVFDRDESEQKLNVVKIDITNENLQNAVDAAELNLLIETDIPGGHNCFHISHEIAPGHDDAPEYINNEFAKLSKSGYTYARTAREIYWKNTDSHYWIQWVIKDDTPTLCAYDPIAEEIVEILKIKG